MSGHLLTQLIVVIMENQFKAGDQAQLISGSITMTVETAWQDG